MFNDLTKVTSYILKFKSKLSRKQFLTFIECQFVSLLLCGTAVFSELLVTKFQFNAATGFNVFYFIK
ncbi:hypothetical protein GJ496_009592 [Pomphorhynchus laevis]|nr:hypothetical protein GJ496_009592 [Pomphorhynchus laevis]